jgi:hypothetical protein
LTGKFGIDDLRSAICKRLKYRLDKVQHGEKRVYLPYYDQFFGRWYDYQWVWTPYRYVEIRDGALEEALGRIEFVEDRETYTGTLSK